MLGQTLSPKCSPRISIAGSPALLRLSARSQNKCVLPFPGITNEQNRLRVGCGGCLAAKVGPEVFSSCAQSPEAPRDIALPPWGCQLVSSRCLFLSRARIERRRCLLEGFFAGVDLLAYLLEPI